MSGQSCLDASKDSSGDGQQLWTTVVRHCCCDEAGTGASGKAGMYTSDVMMWLSKQQTSGTECELAPAPRSTWLKVHIILSIASNVKHVGLRIDKLTCFQLEPGKVSVLCCSATQTRRT